jgi:hypothetical protein
MAAVGVFLHHCLLLCDKVQITHRTLPTGAVEWGVVVWHGGVRRRASAQGSLTRALSNALGWLRSQEDAAQLGGSPWGE